SISLSDGSYGTRTLASLGDWKLGPTAWTGSAQVLDTRGDFNYLDDNATNVSTADDAMRTRLNNQSWSAAARLRGEAPIAEGRTLATSIEWLRRRQGVPGIDSLLSEHATASMERGMIRVETPAPQPPKGGWTWGLALDHERTSDGFEDVDSF